MRVNFWQYLYSNKLSGDALQSVDKFKNSRWKAFTSYEEADAFVKQADDSSLKESNDNGRYYAVRRGRKTGIFSTW